MEKNIKFCADDWGLSPGINSGIIKLAQKNLIYSISFMANAPYLHFGLEELLSIKNSTIKMNIHFNLTHGKALSSMGSFKNQDFIGFGSLFLKSIFRNLKKEEIAAEFVEQVNHLRSFGIPITGVDGHHHVHLLPEIFLAIKNCFTPLVLKEIRIVKDYEHLPTYVQALIFEFFFQSDVKEMHINKCGYLLPKNIKNLYSLNKKINAFEHLIIHPAAYDDFKVVDLKDPLQQERVREFNAIMEYFNEQNRYRKNFLGT